MLEKLADYVLQPGIAAGAVADAVALLRPAASDLDAQRMELERQARATEGQLANLVKAIAAGGPMASLVAARKDREQQLAIFAAAGCRFSGCAVSDSWT